MNIDPKPLNNQETLESTKGKFADKLTNILYEKLTVDNIETFADEALDKAVVLTTEIMEHYYNSDTVNAEIDFKDQEDQAFTELGLPKISNILDRIEEKKKEIDTIKDKIKKEYTEAIITPPQENEGGIIPGDGNGFEKKRILPRLLTLMYILENDLEIDLDNVKITEGQVADNMMRRTPYVRVEIDELDRLVYICDEEGNASYIFDKKKLKEKIITAEDLDIDNKGDKNSLIEMYPGIGVRVVQNKNWRDKVKSYLEDEIPKAGPEKSMLGNIEEFEGEKKSEFVKREKKVYLPYHEWVEELRDIYSKTDKTEITNISTWYVKEAKKHTTWYKGNIIEVASSYNVPVDNIYLAIGFDKKRVKSESYLPYKDFIDELKKAYDNRDKDKFTDFNKWYVQEAKKHNTWYRTFIYATTSYKKTSDDIHREIGHVKKVTKRESFLGYEDFIKELKTVYENTKSEEIDDFSQWYIREAQKHSKWYISHMAHLCRRYRVKSDDIYKAIGYEKKMKKPDEHIKYKDFIAELKNVYEITDKDKIKGIANWYRKESKNHFSWYKDLHHAVKVYGVTVDDIYKEIGYTPKDILNR